MGRTQPEDRPEQHVDSRGAAAATAAGAVDGQEEHAQAEDPGEGTADDDVVGSTPRPEERHGHPEDDAGHEQPDAKIDADGQSDQGPGESNVREGVSGKYLGPEDDEVADKSARGGDGGSRLEGPDHEGVGEHVGNPGDRVGRGEPHSYRHRGARPDAAEGDGQEVGREAESGDEEPARIHGEVGHAETKPHHHQPESNTQRQARPRVEPSDAGPPPPA